MSFAFSAHTNERGVRVEGELFHCRRWESAQCQEPTEAGILCSLDQPNLPCALNLSSLQVHLALAALRCFPSQEDNVAARLREMRIWKDLENKVRDFMLWGINHGETGLGETLLFL